MPALIGTNSSPKPYAVPSHPPTQWGRSSDACMTPTTVPNSLVGMRQSISFTPSPGSSSSSGAVGILPYTIVMGGSNHTPLDGSENGFSSLGGSRPASGGGQEHEEVGGDEEDSEKNIRQPADHVSSPLDGLQRPNALQPLNYSHLGADQLVEQRLSFTSPSPSSLATARTDPSPSSMTTTRIISRPRVGSGRIQHPLNPISGAPPQPLQKAKGPWHKAEDVSLMYWVSHLGTGKWVEIARRVGSRTGKQCRERWTNQLSPDIDHSAFRHEEDLIIITMQQTLRANKWCEVAKYLPGRPENAIKNRWNSRDLQRKRSELQRTLGPQEASLRRRVFEGTSNLKRVREESSGSAGCDEYSAFTFFHRPSEHRNSGQQTNQASKRPRAANGSQRSQSSTPAGHSSDVSGGQNCTRASESWGSKWHASTPPATIQRPYDFASGQYYPTPMESPSYLLDSISSANAVMAHTSSDSRGPPGYPITNYDEVSTPTTYSHSFYSSGEPNSSQSYYTPYAATSESFGVGFNSDGTAVSVSQAGEGRGYIPLHDALSSTHLVTSNDTRLPPTLLNQRSHYVPHAVTSGLDLSSVLRPGSHTLQLSAMQEPQSLLHQSVFREIPQACTDNSNACDQRPESAQPTPSDDNSLDSSWSLGNRDKPSLDGESSGPYSN